MNILLFLNIRLQMQRSFLKSLGHPLSLEELLEMNERGISTKEYCDALKMIHENMDLIDPETLWKRVDSGKSFSTVLHALEQLNMTSRRFSWRFLCAIEDCGVGVEAFVQRIYQLESSGDEFERVAQLEVENSTGYALLFYEGLLHFQKRNYHDAHKAFRTCCSYSDEKELQYYLAESLYRPLEDKLTSESVLSVFEPLRGREDLIYRMADNILVSIQGEHHLTEPLKLTDVEKGVIKAVLKIFRENECTETSSVIEYAQIRGSLYHLLEDYEEAVHCFETALELGSDDQYINFECYLIYEKMGEHEKAQDALERSKKGLCDFSDIETFYSGVYDSF